MREKFISWHKAVYAWQGLKLAFNYEKNFKTEVIIALLVVFFLLILKGSTIDFLRVLSVIFLVLITELINTAIERVVDMIEPNHHPHAKIVKDISAGFVFLSVILSVYVGMVVFYPLVVSKF